MSLYLQGLLGIALTKLAPNTSHPAPSPARTQVGPEIVLLRNALSEDACFVKVTGWYTQNVIVDYYCIKARWLTKYSYNC